VLDQYIFSNIENLFVYNIVYDVIYDIVVYNIAIECFFFINKIVFWAFYYLLDTMNYLNLALLRSVIPTADKIFLFMISS